MSLTRQVWLTALAVATVGPALQAAAWADCAAPPDYTVVITQNTVRVCPTGGQPGDTCSQGATLLRQDEATGAVMAVGNYCDSSASGCYLDECVPEGRYRYGLAMPYQCVSAACGPTAYWEEAAVSSPLPGSCVLSAGDPGDTTYSMPVPWTGSQQYVCFGESSGCSMVRRAQQVPLLVDGAVLLLAGVLLVLRRRARRSR